MLLGLVAPTSGAALIGGRRFAELEAPGRPVGAVLEARAVFPGRRARHHLWALVLEAGIPRSRVDEVLALVELTDAADRRAGTFSLGMGQRLALAGARPAGPQILILDEPTNGLDPAGMRWLRSLLRELAGEGRTVIVSSHALAEVQRTVDKS